MTTTLHIPARSFEEARKIAYAIDAGLIAAPRHYRDQYLAEAEAENLAALHADSRYRAIPIEIVSTVTHDGRIRVARAARIIDGAGSLAAALLLIFGGCWAVAHASLL